MGALYKSEHFEVHGGTDAHVDVKAQQIPDSRLVQGNKKQFVIGIVGFPIASELNVATAITAMILTGAPLLAMRQLWTRNARIRRIRVLTATDTRELKFLEDVQPKCLSQVNGHQARRAVVAITDQARRAYGVAGCPPFLYIK